MRQLSISARGVGFDQSGTTMGRTGRPHHSPLTMSPTAHHVWTLIRMLRVPPPATGPNRVLRAASRPRELRDSVPYATRAAAGRWTQPGSTGRQPAAGATRLCSVRYACRHRPLDPTGFYGPPAGRWSYVTTHLGIDGRGTTRVPQAAGGPMELLVDAALPGRIRPY